MPTPLVETWRMSHEATMYLLGAVPAGLLASRYAPRTRTVAAQFAHLHNVRRKWLSHAAPQLAAGLEGFARGAEPRKGELKKALQRSAKAIERHIAACEEAGKVKSWRGSPATFVGYLVAHEAHHRGLALVAIRLAGHRMSDEVIYGLWQWGMARVLRGASASKPGR